MRSEFKEYYISHQKPRKCFVRNIFEQFILFLSIIFFKKIGLGSEKWHWVQHYVARMPSTSFCSTLRTAFYETTLKDNCKGRFYCLPYVCINFPQRVFIGDNVFINRNVNIVARDTIKIGNNVMIGPNTVINSGSHKYDDKTKLIREQGHKKGPITIGDNVFIGGNVFILPGVVVGEGAVVGAGSVVTKDVDPFTVVVGNPASILKRR